MRRRKFLCSASRKIVLKIKFRNFVIFFIMKRESYLNTEKMTDFNYYHDYHVSSKPDRCQVLDLSRRRDSIETRKTPSPCNTLSSIETGSPNTNSKSPLNPLLLRHGLAHQNNSAYTLENLHHTKNSIVSNPISYPVVYPEFKCGDATRSSFAYTQQQNLFQPINAISSPPLQLSKIQHEPQNVRAPVENDNGMAGVPAPATILYPKIFSNEGKPTRPFKAYPRDPMIIAANFAATDVLYNGPRVERYTEYRKRVLEQIQTANGGQRTITNPKMRRTNSRNGRQKRTHFASSESEDRCAESSDNDTGSTNDNNMQKSETEGASKDNNNSPAVPNQNGSVKDAAYYERRRKNNAAAKKSRDRRRIKEDEIAIRAAYLERQNIELLCQLDALKAQLEALTKC